MASEPQAVVHLRWAFNAATKGAWEILAPGDVWVVLDDTGKRSSRKRLEQCARAWAKAHGVRLAKAITLDVLSAPQTNADHPPRTVGKPAPRSWWRLRPGEPMVFSGRAGVLATYVVVGPPVEVGEAGPAGLVEAWLAQTHPEKGRC